MNCDNDCDAGGGQRLTLDGLGLPYGIPRMMEPMKSASGTLRHVDKRNRPASERRPIDPTALRGENSLWRTLSHTGYTEQASASVTLAAGSAAATGPRTPAAAFVGTSLRVEDPVLPCQTDGSDGLHTKTAREIKPEEFLENPVRPVRSSACHANTFGSQKVQTECYKLRCEICARTIEIPAEDGDQPCPSCGATLKLEWRQAAIDYEAKKAVQP